MRKNILITGGPVHAFLDDVKIITNKFKGGLMVDLAGRFVDMAENLHAEKKVHRGEDKADIHVTYLCSKSATQPQWSDYLAGENTPHLHCVHHYGIDDYMRIVCELTPQMDAVILGAAVANLIPKNKIKGKFDSHNYKPGDTIPIDFTIAPRVIDEVKKINPKCHLFGFKLLSGVDYYELIRAAYGVLLESKAVTVFANDAKDLMQKYAVTKERGVHPIHNGDVAQWIFDRMGETYYKTHMAKTDREVDAMKRAKGVLKSVIEENKNSFIKVDEGYVFGSAAFKFGESDCWAFVTTARGKNEAEDFAFVDTVKHDSKEVYTMTTKKASLNAPLFHYIFLMHPTVVCIQHYHHQREDLITLDYATPGTYEDSHREEVRKHASFNIKGHGCILSYDVKGNLIK